MNMLKRMGDVLTGAESSGTAAQACVALFPLAALPLFLACKLLAPAAYTALVQEDAALENLQAALYFAGGLAALAASRRALRSCGPAACGANLLLGLGLLLACGEEVSWAQRLCCYQTPALIEAGNTQHEMSLHNLGFFQRRLHALYMLAGLYGATAWLALPRLRGRAGAALAFLAPQRRCALYFLAVFCTYALLEYGLTHAGSVAGRRLSEFLIWRDQEPAELMLALGCLLFAAQNYRRAGAPASGPGA